jgi:hypothetical protein
MILSLSYGYFSFFPDRAPSYMHVAFPNKFEPEFFV